VSQPTSAAASTHPQTSASDASTAPTAGSPRKMSTRNRFLFFLIAWLIVLMPFLFWWSTWFGRRLSDQQLSEYLSDEKHPRHIQHALVQLSERISRGDASATRWYPGIVRLASYPVVEVRNTDAWVMGQDPSAVSFHQTLLKMLGDSSALVRGNAALSLVRFGDASGRQQILELLQPAEVIAPNAGVVTDASAIGTTVRQGGLIAKLQTGGPTIEVRSPITGRIRTIAAPAGSRVAAGTELASVDPGDDQVWEALRALYFVGGPGDLIMIQRYERDSPQISDRVRQQAALTEKAIRKRSAEQP